MKDENKQISCELPGVAGAVRVGMGERGKYEAFGQQDLVQ